jgi:hypothetical protein
VRAKDRTAQQKSAPIQNAEARDEAGFVQRKKDREGLLIHITDQIGTEKGERITSIDDVNGHLRTLENAPQLFPNLRVLLERREDNAVGLFEDGEAAAPFDNLRHLELMEAIVSCVRVPGRAAGHCEAVAEDGFGRKLLGSGVQSVVCFFGEFGAIEDGDGSALRGE